MNNKKIKLKAYAVFISCHGYGHVSRMRHVIKEMDETSKGRYKVLVFTNCNPYFFMPEDYPNTKLISFVHDVGLKQFDSVSIDYKGTLKRLKAFYNEKNDIINKIIELLSPYEILAILSDTSSLPLEAAAILNVPGYFAGNFTWSDIYRDLSEIEPEFMDYIPYIDEEYLSAKLSFVLPMHTCMSPFKPSATLSIPFIAPKPSFMTEQGWENLTGIKYERNRTHVLLSFGGFDLDNLPVEHIDSMKEEYLFISTRASGKIKIKNLIQVDPLCKGYSGLIKYSDIVITKPGYGIISDCLTEKKPIIYTDRGRFAEYGVLKSWLDNNFSSVYIPSYDFLKGNWGGYLNKALNSEKKFPEVSVAGAEIIVDKLTKEMYL